MYNIGLNMALDENNFVRSKRCSRMAFFHFFSMSTKQKIYLNAAYNGHNTY